MDFLGDLLDFGDRNNRRGGRHGHDDDDDEHYRTSAAFQLLPAMRHCGATR